MVCLGIFKILFHSMFLISVKIIDLINKVDSCYFQNAVHSLTSSRYLDLLQFYVLVMPINVIGLLRAPKAYILVLIYVNFTYDIAWWDSFVHMGSIIKSNWKKGSSTLSSHTYWYMCVYVYILFLRLLLVLVLWLLYLKTMYQKYTFEFNRDTLYSVRNILKPPEVFYKWVLAKNKISLGKKKNWQNGTTCTILAIAVSVMHYSFYRKCYKNIEVKGAAMYNLSL